VKSEIPLFSIIKFSQSELGYRTWIYSVTTVKRKVNQPCIIKGSVKTLCDLQPFCTSLEVIWSQVSGGVRCLRLQLKAQYKVFFFPKPRGCSF